jgi:acetyl esterase
MPIDSDALRLIELVKASGRPRLETMSAPDARQAYRRAAELFSPAPPEVASCVNRTIPGPGGEIPIRIYRGHDAPQTGAPALLYIHGGGWVIGDLDTHDYLCRKFANDARALVVAVDYRLAPEHKFPAAVEDCMAAAQWLSASAGALGVDAEKLAVGGDSAGGNLSAVLSLMGRDGAGPRFMFQLLLYPAVDASFERPSFAATRPDAPLTDVVTRYFLDHYKRAPEDARDWRMSPYLASRHDDLPPAFILTARHDPLCDEGRDYAELLEKAGVSVWRLDINDQVHGFLTNGKAIRAAERALDMAAAALRHAFQTA